ncbi:MAG: hypothetical protein NVS3B7_01050 [Candidatus Elarobacter sp.]
MLAAVLFALASATFQPVSAATTAQPPQVFVRDAAVQAQTAGEDAHDFGLRAPRDNDADSAPLVNAHGEAIHAALGVWRTAEGTASFEPGPRATRVHAAFHHLIPQGRYSLFVRQLAGKTGAVFTPLDLVGATNSFNADAEGNAETTVGSPLSMPAGSQLVLVYHSDGADHQSSIGVLGTNAHPQLITRVP